MQHRSSFLSPEVECQYVTVSEDSLKKLLCDCWKQLTKCLIITLSRDAAATVLLPQTVWR